MQQPGVQETGERSVPLLVDQLIDDDQEVEVQEPVYETFVLVKTDSAREIDNLRRSKINGNCRKMEIGEDFEVPKFGRFRVVEASIEGKTQTLIVNQIG